ncbi:MAG: hypothetical protein A3G34_06970 [Candidatus Lindowbacteria bacterium RIFCSPLOWO2_12_FULL_62_27]|nr:MAG: hypothetical protein A3G34_06970 [Candidatus Lindowbacteria bacterium RIFCSPLOWO2_12_FULL_62_27]OGH61286.1 MAG: hypothetical protein A3I06_03380 [Candidatus Lindowbacteria bacterium RIFCSPLOWO2_02_FULL_62_12]
MSKFAVFLCVSIAATFEGASVWVLFTRTNLYVLRDWILPVCLHLVSTAALTAAGNVRKDFDGQRLAIFLGTLFFYPIGGAAFSFVLLVMLIRRDALKVGVMEDYHKAIETEMQREDQLGRIMDIEEEIGRQMEIQPLVDLIHGRDVTLRRAATKYLGKLETRDSVRLLQNLLKDSDREVRFYASSSLAKIDEKLSKRIRTLAAESAARAADVLLLKELGYAYLEYIQAGTLDAIGERYHLDQCAETFGKVLSYEQDSETHFSMGRVMFKLGRIDEAERHLSRAIEMDPKNVDAYFWRAEIFFRRRDFLRVAEDCRATRAFGDLNTTHQLIAPWWAESLS